MKWTNEEVEYLISNVNLLSRDELCLKLNRSKDLVNKKIRLLNLTNKNVNKWRNEEVTFLKENYSIMDIDIICKKLNRNLNSIYLKASELNLKKEVKKTGFISKYNVNKDYFKNIDTPNKAYYLGWAITDGNIVYDINKGHYQYRIRLSSVDIDILEKFKNDIKSEAPILFRENNKFCEINICSKQFVSNLINKGCVPNKTFNVNFPNIKEKFIWDFIKGLFDGDGSYINTEKTNKITFVSASNNMIESLSKILNYYGIKHNITNCKNKYSILEISSKKSKIKFLNSIINTKSDFLNRKHKKMLSMLNL